MIKFDDELKRAESLAKSEPDEALRICCSIMNEDFDGQHGQMALFLTGYIMQEAGRHGLAYHIYERCSQLRPNVSSIYSNMGMCFDNYDERRGRKYFQKAQLLDSNNALAYANEALSCLQMARPERCIELSNKALSIDPSLRSAKHNRGLAKLMLRDWRGGWADYFESLGVKHREARDYGLPNWNGEPGKVVVYGEQGIGDEIMFASCLPDIMQTNNIVLDCDARIQSLFARSFECPVYGTRFMAETDLLDDHEPQYQCAIGQLPKFYRNTEESYPCTKYLNPDPDLSYMWGELFKTLPGKKIGIAWTGGLVGTGQKKRSFNLTDLEPLLKTNNTFVSLEYLSTDQSLLDKYGVRSYPRITGKGCNIDDLAALISRLDCVVTCCTAVFHIAGAVGTPCYVLTPDEPPYIMCTSGDLPWYNCVKTVRKSANESWRSVVVRAADLIKKADYA